jgi:predicted transcriptional regulator
VAATQPIRENYLQLENSVSKKPKAPRRAAAVPQIHDVRLLAEGAAKVLGDLEARVMRAVWRLGRPAPARVVHGRVAREHKVELLTVITVLNKLVGKGLLSREKRDDLLHYEARYTEDEFTTFASRRVVEGILSFGPEAVAASLVDVLAERDPEQLAELGRLIRRRLKEQDG